MKLLKEKYKNFCIYTYFCGIRLFKRRAFKPFTPKENPVKTKKNKQILIVKADSLGDYVLMRNFWQEIRKTEAYKNAHITLVLSSCTKGFADYLDSGVIDEMVFVPHLLFEKIRWRQEIALRRYLSKIMKNYYDEIWFPSQNVYNFRYINYFIMRHVSAGAVIGSSGDMPLNCHDYFRPYTLVLPVKSVDFEFELNKNFFEKVLKRDIHLNFPEIALPKCPSVQTGYAVISPGAQHAYRCWYEQNFADLIKYLKKEYRLNVFLIGSVSEKLKLQRINALSGNLGDVYAGRPYKEILQIIQNSALYIGNDSGFFHVAAALKTPAVCISSGGAYPRFMKYPPSRLYEIVMNADMRKNAEKQFHSGKEAGYGPINAVSLPAVYAAVDKQLKGNEIYEFKAYAV